MYLGSDISGLEDIQLASVLGRATSIVNSFLSVPTIPQQHDLRGGSIVGEEHHWRTTTSPFEMGQSRAYPFHWPFKVVSSFRIYVTATQYVEIPTSALVIRNTGKYIEVVSLVGTAFGLFNTSLLLPMLYLATPTLVIDYTYGQTFDVAGEQIYSSDGLTFRAQSQWWDRDVTPKVYRNGTIVDPANYDINYDEGIVVFKQAISNSTASPDVVTADYTYKLHDDYRDATALVARAELGLSRIAARGWQGLSSVRMGELAITMNSGQRMGRGQVTANNLRQTVPEAAELLEGHTFWRLAGS